MAVLIAVADYIIEHARLSGEEICGALFARAGVVVDATLVLNRSTDRKRSFFIPAIEVFRLERAAEANGLELVGFFHSHPDGTAVPSTRDLALAVPGFFYLIAARTGEMRAWRLRDDRTGFDELSLEAA